MEPKAPFADCANCTLSGEPFCGSTGPTDAPVVIVGEAPGFSEAVQGQPFVGPSGKLLDATLGHVGVNRNEVFITNVCLCHPPENRTPTKAEIKCCSERLKHEVSERNPAHIIALGNTASMAIMGKPVKITQFRAGPPKESSLYPETKIIPTFHPAACLRNGDNFPSMVGDFEKLSKPYIGWEPPKFKVFTDYHEAFRAMKEIDSITDKIVIDIETAFDKDNSFEHANHYALICIGICYAPGKAIVLGEELMANEAFLIAFGEWLEHKKIIAHNGKFDLSGMVKFTNAKLWFDTMLAHYCLDERGGTHGLKYLAAEFLGAPDYDSALKKYRSFAAVPRPILYEYNAYDVACTWLLYEKFVLDLEVEGLRPLHDYLIAASNVLQKVELGGIGINEEYLDQLEVDFSKELEASEAALFEWVNNPRSPKQVKEALESMKVYVESTAAEILEDLLTQGWAEKAHPFIERLLDYRKMQKLYGTYIKGSQNRIFEGRLYPNFLLHGTTSGRLSCRNPNLQNIPRGSAIRSLFVPAPGNVFVQADYSQIEYRIVATLAQEPYLANIFRNPDRDLFNELTASVFGPNWVKEERQRMKIFAHGSNYGGGYKTLAAQSGMAEEAAKKLQAEYFSTIPNVVKWRKAVHHKIFNEGDDLVTHFGRHRRFWLITEQNRYAIEKEALAFEPQSTASDICLNALIRLHDQYGLTVRLPVHDSIMVECPADAGEDVGRLMEKVMMEEGAKFSTFVPFAVDVQITNQSWGAFR